MIKPQTIKRLLPLTLAVTLAGAARADYNPVPLTDGSYNADVVVEKTAPLPLYGSTSATLDTGTNNTGYTFYEQGFASFPLAGTAKPTGLPTAGTTFSAADDANHKFQMPLNYKTNNALFLGNYAGCTTGTLTLSTPAAYTRLSILATAASAPENNTITIHYAGGGTQTTTLSIGDWFSGTPVAWYAGGRVSVDGGNLDYGNFYPLGNGNPRLLYIDLDLSDSTHNVTSVDFAYTDGGRAGVFGLSGSTDGMNFTPVVVSGFNRDIIVEASAPKQGFTPTVSVTLDSGPNLTGWMFYETGFNSYTNGLPHPGANVVSGSRTWTMASNYATNNCVFVGDYDGLRTSTVTLNNPKALSGLSFLTAAGNGPTSIAVDVMHEGGAVESLTISSIDWGVNSSVAYTPGGRVYPLILYNLGTTFYLHNADITLADTNTPVTSVTFTYQSQGRAVIYAVAGKTPTGSTYDPVAVSGFNADGIIEKEATPLVAPLTTVTTVSMDGGTANTGNTWYEQGYYRALPNSGLPAAGSTIRSASLPDHYYQMAPSYTTNNAIYVDSANPTANLTIKNPATLSALSFLSACANGWVSNSCVMQYQDGTSETNYFVSQDWFNKSPVAWYANGRVNLNNRSLNNLSASPGNPRLYEAQFVLGNTGSRLTNVVLNYLASESGTRSRMVVLAVSGTAGAVAPILAIGAPVPYVNVFEGSNLVLNAQITGGTEPITKTWIFSGNGGASWTPLANGGTVSGANTTSFTNSAVVFANTGLYALVAQNVAGSVTSAVATVSVLSTLPDVTAPTDPIAVYAPNGGNAGANEGVANALDNTTSKYFNSAAGTAPFSGPVGFVVTPARGKTTVSALRFYTANDFVGRDPADYTLEGSNDGGNTWETIATGPLALPSWRNGGGAALSPLTPQYLQEVRFANTNGYNSYRVSFASIKDNANTSSIQIGEVELIGVQTPLPPIITLEPVASAKVFVGASPTFSVEAYGYPTNLTYQWYLNGTTAINGATNASYTFPNAQLTDSGKSFSCSISNTNGTTNSTSVVLTVIPRPTAAYPVAVLADNPAAFYRLDEGPDDQMGNNGVTANDYVGAHTGVYNNTALGVTGYTSVTDSNTAASFGTIYGVENYVGGIADLSFATPNTQNAAFSVEAWVNGQNQSVDAGIITKGTGAGGEQYNLDTGAGNHSFRFFVRNAAGSVASANGSIAPDGNWHHLVGVCDEANGKVYLYVDGALNGSGSITPGSGILASTQFLSIGSRQSGTTLYDNQFVGTVDEVAVYNQALSLTQVQKHYYAAGIAPFMAQQPTNTIGNEGAAVTFYAVARGTPALAYQWYLSDGYQPLSPLAGQTGSNLVLNAVSVSQNGTYYQVVVTNVYGTVTSAAAALSVVQGPPNLQVDLQPLFQRTLEGLKVTYSVDVAGSAPFYYRWYRNGVVLPGVTGSTYTFPTLPGTNVYSVTVSNTYNGGTVVSSSLATNIGLALTPATSFAVNFHNAANAAAGSAMNYADILYVGLGAYADATNHTLWNPFGVDSSDNTKDQTSAPAQTSSGYGTAITLTLAGTSGDNGGLWFDGPDGQGGNSHQGTPFFLLGNAANVGGANPTASFTLSNVPPGTYTVYLYGANYDGDRGSQFSLSSGTAHNGISRSANNRNNNAFVEGENYVVFQGVTPDANGIIRGTFTAFTNPNTGQSGEANLNGLQLVKVPAGPVLTVTPSGANVVVSWAPAGGILQTATTAAGPYVDQPGATSPYTNAVSATPLFFRVRAPLP